MRRRSATLAVLALVAGAAAAPGCSSPDPGARDGCVGAGAAALRTCAKGTTLSGVDVSYYQGNVTWAQVKASGRDFAFVRISDGLNHPDTKFAQNWPGAKAAGLVRGSYQFFRPGQDADQQAQMVLDALDDAGGLLPGDLPPVLDLEAADSQASSVVVSKALAWLAKIEAAIGIKPVVYTANFMSSVIGDNFGAYTLWVANYTTSCPLMPSGWSDWQFWQSSDSGSVPGIAGAADTDLFNGTLAQLQALTVKAGAPVPPPAPDADAGPRGSADPPDGESTPKDGSHGSTIGEGPAPSAPHSGRTAPTVRCP